MSETLVEIGEFGLIDKIQEVVRKQGPEKQGMTLGIGDDCASFKPRSGYELLITCDCVLEGRHYLAEHTSLFDLGRRAMAMNISDIGAMGGKPIYALVSLGLKGNTHLRDVEALYCGFMAELNPFEAVIIGGNIARSEANVFIDITLIGEVEKEKMVCRSTAKVGDTILVTGYPGRAAAGLQLLNQAKHRANLSGHSLVRAYNLPSHRAREGHAIARAEYASAMIDTSDGLLGDLAHICRESMVGAALIQERLPISNDLSEAARHLKQDPLDFVLGESDDYELIITCPPDRVAPIRELVASLGETPVTEVGEITSGDAIVLISPSGMPVAMSPSGWNHFAEKA